MERRSCWACCAITLTSCFEGPAIPYPVDLFTWGSARSIRQQAF